MTVQQADKFALRFLSELKRKKNKDHPILFKERFAYYNSIDISAQLTSKPTLVGKQEILTVSIGPLTYEFVRVVVAVNRRIFLKEDWIYSNAWKIKTKK